MAKPMFFHEGIYDSSAGAGADNETIKDSHGHGAIGSVARAEQVAAV